MVFFVGFGMIELMTGSKRNRGEFKPSNEWLAVEALLASERRFLTMLEVMDGAKLEPAKTMSTLDDMYRRQAILKQFSNGEHNIVVAANEVMIPEVGFSDGLEELFRSAGMAGLDFLDLEVRYGLNERSHGAEAILLPPTPSISS